MPSSACSSSFSWSSRTAPASSSAGDSAPASGLASPAAVGGRGSTASLLCLVLAGLLWGTGGLTGTLLGRAAGLPPLSVAAVRLLGGGTLIVVFLIVPGRRWPAGRAAWTRVTVTGLLAATFQGAYFSAVSLTSVSLATLVTIGATPVIVLAAELALGRRRPGWPAAARTLLALAGLGLLVGLPAGGYGTLAVLGSAGMALLASAGFATLTLIGSVPVKGLDDVTVTGLGFTAGGLALLPLAAASGLELRPTFAALGWLAALATGPTAVAYTLYFRGLRAAQPSTAALLSLLEPLTATLLSVLLLGNRLSTAGIAGAALLATAVALSVTGRGYPALATALADADADASPRSPRTWKWQRYGIRRPAAATIRRGTGPSEPGWAAGPAGPGGAARSAAGAAGRLRPGILRAVGIRRRRLLPGKSTG
jgi:DME family drug/metabolite transporter